MGTLSKNKSPFRGLLARRDRGGRRLTGGHLRSGLSKVRRRAGRNPVIFLRATALNPCSFRSKTIRLQLQSQIEAHSLKLFVRARTSDRKSTRLNSSHLGISYAVFCLK